MRRWPRRAPAASLLGAAAEQHELRLRHAADRVHQLLQAPAGHQPAEVEHDRPRRVDRVPAWQVAKLAALRRRTGLGIVRDEVDDGKPIPAPQVADDRRADGQRGGGARDEPALDESVIELAEPEVEPPALSTRAAEPQVVGVVDVRDAEALRGERDRHQGIRVVRVEHRRTERLQPSREPPLVDDEPDAGDRRPAASDAMDLASVAVLVRGKARGGIGDDADPMAGRDQRARLLLDPRVVGVWIADEHHDVVSARISHRRARPRPRSGPSPPARPRGCSAPPSARWRTGRSRAPGQRAGEVAIGHQRAVDPVANDLAQPADGARHHPSAAGDGLDGDESERLGDATASARRHARR